MQHLVTFARSAGVLASLTLKDLSSLVPDGEFFLSRETVLVDFSGTHPLSPSLLSSPQAMSAIERRETSKSAKYHLHCLQLKARFIPFVMDSYGGLGSKALGFLNDLEREASLLKLPILFESPKPLSSHLSHIPGSWTTHLSSSSGSESPVAFLSCLA